MDVVSNVMEGQFAIVTLGAGQLLGLGSPPAGLANRPRDNQQKKKRPLEISMAARQTHLQQSSFD